MDDVPQTPSHTHTIVERSKKKNQNWIKYGNSNCCYIVYGCLKGAADVFSSLQMIKEKPNVFPIYVFQFSSLFGLFAEFLSTALFQ